MWITMQLCFKLIAVTAVTWNAVHASFITQPSDVTVNVGSSVMFQCKDSDTAAGLTWIKDGKTKLFLSGNPTVMDANKYAVNGTYNLVVKSAAMSDGGTYGCDVTSELSDVFGNLVVIGPVTLTDNLMGQTLTAGKTVVYSCTLQYGAPSTSQQTPNPLSINQDPQLELYVGTTKLMTSTPTAMGIVPPFTKTVNATYVVAQADAGKAVRCRVFSTAPFYEYSVTSTLNMPFAPNTLVFSIVETNNSLVTQPSSGQNQFYAGNTINCSANGFPTPSVTWSQTATGQKVTGGMGTGYALLRLTTGMLGQNKYRCNATNAATNTPGATPAFSDISFTVVDQNEASVNGAEFVVARLSGIGIFVYIFTVMSVLLNV